MGLQNWLQQRTARRGASTPAVVPATATFRRAVGLSFQLNPCEGLTRVDISASRHEGSTHVSMTLAQAAVLFRMSSWQTADELGVAHARLVELVDHNLVYWSDTRPTQQLSGAVVESLERPLSLRRNVWPTPVMVAANGTPPAGIMPRMGTLDGVTLVGTQFGVMEQEVQTHTITVACCARHGMQLRTWLAALDGRRTCKTLVTNTEEAALLNALNRLGLLENREAAPAWDGRPRLTWLGHATVVVETCGKRILVDPLFHPFSIPSRPGLDVPPDPASVGPVDAVLITHGDHDHFNPLALARLDRSTPILFPRARANHAWHVDMPRMLEVLGFTNVTAMDADQKVAFGDVIIHALAFTGEDWGLELPQLTYVIASPPLNVYLNADCYRMDELYRRVAREYQVDVAFLGVSGCAEPHLMAPGFGYGNFYGPWMTRQKANQWIELCAGPVEAADAAELLGARRAFGYAAGGATFVPLAFSDRGTHVDMARILKQRGSSCEAWALGLGVPTLAERGAVQKPGRPNAGR